MESEVLEKSGKTVVLLGNEAIARGAMEAGVGVVAAYPGTPSSEVPVTMAGIAKKIGFYFEYSSNEKVAFETAAGAAWSGVRALTTVKHFGLNVAADSVSPVAYVGVKGGFVIMVADDPNGWSSAQSEQDTRYYARMFKIPMFEPSNPQECLDFTKKCFDISEEFEMPIFLRTTTKVSHSIGSVKLGEIKSPNRRGHFEKSDRYYNLRPKLQEMHQAIDKKLDGICKKYSKVFNTIEAGKGNIGIIASGVSYGYAKELMHVLNLKVPLAKVGLSFPLSTEFISKFIKGKKEVLILEELESVLESEINAIAKNVNPKIIVHGKDILPNYGEYTLELLAPAFEKIFKKKLGINFKKQQKMVKKVDENLPPRKPVFCPGCPHRSTFYAVKQVYGDNAIYAGDVGCYVLGIFEPYKTIDFMISMGASLGLAHGISRVSAQDIVAFIGDSTFFHAGLPALANLKFNDGTSPLIVVLDNSVTAMTGHQPHPGTGRTGMGDITEKIKIEDVAKAMGAEVRVANAFNQKQLIETIKEMRKMKGLRVLISRGECRLVTKRKFEKQGIPLPVFEIDPEKCVDCEKYANTFACPAITKVKDTKGGEPKYEIDPDLC